jgi:hypothetical protein
MEKNGISHRTLPYLVWPVTLLGAVGLWFGLAHGDSVTMPLVAVALVLTAILGAVWLSRAQATRRFNAAMDAYARREIDRLRPRKGPQRVRSLSIRGRALPDGATHGR